VVGSAPLRTVHRADALEWLRAHRAAAGTSVVTSLPDISELGLDQAKWQAWFVDAARAVIEWVPDDGVAIFFQSDIVRGGVWIEKSYLVLRAAEAAFAPLVWHKIVCRSPPGTSVRGRASYSHLLCFARRHPPSQGAYPDVLPDAGFMPSKKAMGVAACRLACGFLRDHTPTRLVVDPFCGQGTLLAVANGFGFDAVGVDRNARCCSAARKLVLGG
jgi:hypothetical protein